MKVHQRLLLGVIVLTFNSIKCITTIEKPLSYLNIVYSNSSKLDKCIFVLSSTYYYKDSSSTRRIDRNAAQNYVNRNERLIYSDLINTYKINQNQILISNELADNSKTPCQIRIKILENVASYDPDILSLIGVPAITKIILNLDITLISQHCKFDFNESNRINSMAAFWTLPTLGLLYKPRASENTILNSNHKLMNEIIKTLESSCN